MSDTQTQSGAVDTIPMTDDGLVIPDQLVGFTGTLVVEWPNNKMWKQECETTGVPEVCDWICRGIMPESTDGNGVPGGHLRIDGELYEIADERSEKVAAEAPR